MATWNGTTRRWTFARREASAWKAKGFWPVERAERLPEAVHIEFDAASGTFAVYMDDDVDLVFPADACAGLSGERATALAGGQVAPGGAEIVWPALGRTLAVADLLAGRLVARAPDVPPPPSPKPTTSKPPTSKSPAPKPTASKALAKASPATMKTLGEVPPLGVVHGTWVPGPGGAFDRDGAFHLWVEGAAEGPPGPACLAGAALEGFLSTLVGAPPRNKRPPSAVVRLHLPTADGAPLPSPELARWLDQVPADEADVRPWLVEALPVPDPFRVLPELAFAAVERPEAVQIGADLAFWLHVLQAVKDAIRRDQYVPALRLAPPASTGRRKADPPEVRTAWEFVSSPLDGELRRLAAAMPPVCRMAASHPTDDAGAFAAEPLLRHCAAVLLDGHVRGLGLPQSFLKRLERSFLEAAALPRGEAPSSWTARTLDLDTYRRWRAWRDRLAQSHTAPAFDLAFQLAAPGPGEREDAGWRLDFVAVSRVDPSLRLPLADHWGGGKRGAAKLAKGFGADFDRQVLLLLGQAARMVPLLWRGLEDERPAGLALTLAEAHAFLKEHAWLLEDAGFKVIVPAWWTPEGRKRLRARMVPASAAKGPAKAAKGAGLGLDAVLAFRYELSLGGEPLTPAEWQALVAAKTPLVRFRGEWVEVDPAQMARVRALVDEAGAAPQPIAPLALVRAAAEAAAGGDVELGGELAAIAERLADPRALVAVPPPAGLTATLRDYQARGLAWLAFLDELGLNGCLADDMGLGKTVQVIARLAHEREGGAAVGPTLLVAPTSVVGNWAKELARFAPGLRAHVHHGADRLTAEGFAAAAAVHDVMITSYALVRRDEAALAAVPWHRVVLDEAQNVKNPAAAQTRAIRRLKATHRLALTGTPVENRLLDLWSLFDFLNPGYLGKEAAFRKAFETPIQRDRDAGRAELLRRLTGPLILRRVKTDPAIIQDLPDKVEQKLYCPLTPEQASLYEAVVAEAAAAVEDSAGIQRKGLVLATLMKLKQVCNHPAQLLQDGSAFDAGRSHKLARLTDHAREVLAGGESLLVFTQFAELGGQLERHLRQALGADVHFLHGGTSRPARERMITTFQDPASPPSVFVLSLKAGGVGITLTKANHVFHFDRWWNPAVEEQATDRAFRIGQRRNVFVHKFVTLGTLEERIDAMLEDKRKLSAAVVGADESWLAGLDNEAFRALIALDRTMVEA